MDVSRLAPSPTGALHLGNARSFLLNWALARRGGWTLAMRVEDLDGPRVKAGATRQALDLLRWLGLDWDGEPLVQSADLAPYRDALHELGARGAVYQCDLSRREVVTAASAPHAGEHELRFPPELRAGDEARYEVSRTDCNYRLVVDDGVIEIEDRVAGRRRFNPAAEVGDFVVWTKRDVPAYQLAVVVDDLRQGVTDVVRGDDLLPSAARQTLVYRALGRTPPRWWHLPLVLGPDGRRLAKRHGDTRLVRYRDGGVPAERVVGLLAYWSGVSDQRVPMTSRQFAHRFELSGLPRRPITFTEDDERWLRSA